MLKKLYITGILILMTGLLLTGCSKSTISKNDGVVDQQQAAQVSDSQDTSSDTTPNTASDTTSNTASDTTSNTASDTTPNSAGAEQYVRTDDGEGGVQVKAIWITPDYIKAIGDNDLAKKYDLKNNIIVEIAMTTHMGDLTQYQPLDNVTLKVDGKVIKPARWDVLSSSPHHPEGVLVFPAKSDVKSNGANLQLSLRQLNGVPERKLTW